MFYSMLEDRGRLTTDGETIARLTAERDEALIDREGMMIEAFHRGQERDAAEARVKVLEEACGSLLDIRAVWTDPHNDDLVAKARAALKGAKP